MLTNKVAVITGASRGIGKAIALAFARMGARIAVIYAGNEQAAKQTLSELAQTGVQAKAYPCDVSDFEATAQLIKDVLADFGGVDILVNNAGVTRDGLLLNMKEQDYDRVLDVNLKGAFNLTRHVYAHMMKKRAGRIINITSVSGIMGNAGQANYSAAKAGLIGLTKAVARELASRSVTCNAIAPGYIDTDMTAGLSEKVKLAALEQIPLRRMGTPEDIANMAVFLAGEQAGYITGQVFQVDGGLCM